MGMPHAAEPWTAALVRTLPHDGNRYELVSGQLVVTPAPRGLHQTALTALYDRLAPYVRRSGLGYLLWSPADISLGEDEVLQPDLFVARTASGSPVRDWGDVTGLVLAIEVASPASARQDRTLKRIRYQRAEVPEYWVVDLDARRVERWRPHDLQPERLVERLGWRPDPARDGLEIDLAGYFGEIYGEAN